MKNATRQQINATFTEWIRRFQEEPERYQREQVALLMTDTPQTYGDDVTPYFLSILAEIQAR